MYRKQERTNERYDSQRNNKFIDYISKQIQGRASKQKNNRLYSNNNKTGGSNLNSSEIYTQNQITSQQQITKPRRGASIIRNNSKTKYAESMGKFRKEFIKDSYVNFQYQSHQRKTTKEEQSSANNQLNFDEQLGIEELHYQMVRLHQNIKKLQHDS